MSGSFSPSFGAPDAYPGPAMYEPPRKKRGMKRIVFGILGILANLIGLFVMPFVAAFVVAIVGILGVAPVSLGGPSGAFTASATSVHYVYVPVSDVASATCAPVGGYDVEWDTDSTGLPATIDGQEYASVGAVSVTSDQDVTIACEGASDVAVSDMGIMGTLIGFGVGLLIPVILGSAALVLLIWGIVARVRS